LRPSFSFKPNERENTAGGEERTAIGSQILGSLDWFEISGVSFPSREGEDRRHEDRSPERVPEG
jgi:hypothetical protein